MGIQAMFGPLRGLLCGEFPVVWEGCFAIGLWRFLLASCTLFTGGLPAFLRSALTTFTENVQPLPCVSPFMVQPGIGQSTCLFIGDKAGQDIVKIPGAIVGPFGESFKDDLIVGKGARGLRPTVREQHNITTDLRSTHHGNFLRGEPV